MTAPALTPDEVCALQMFQNTLRNKRAWRSALRQVWENSGEYRHSMGRELRALRNKVGPSGLDGVKL